MFKNYLYAISLVMFTAKAFGFANIGWFICLLPALIMLAIELIGIIAQMLLLYYLEEENEKEEEKEEE